MELTYKSYMSHPYASQQSLYGAAIYKSYMSHTYASQLLKPM